MKLYIDATNDDAVTLATWPLTAAEWRAKFRSSGPPSHAEEWALRQGMEISARHLPEDAGFEARAALATEIGNALTDIRKMCHDPVHQTH